MKYKEKQINKQTKSINPIHNWENELPLAKHNIAFLLSFIRNPIWIGFDAERHFSNSLIRYI